MDNSINVDTEFGIIIDIQSFARVRLLTENGVCFITKNGSILFITASVILSVWYMQIVHTTLSGA